MMIRQLTECLKPLSMVSAGEAFYHVGSLFVKTDERRERKEEDPFDAGIEFCFSETLVIDLSDGKVHYLNEDTPVSPVECEIVFSIDMSGDP